MRVILIRDVDRVGTAGEVKDVANGYGRNYLLPKGLAELVSPDGLKRADEYRKAEERRHQALNAEMEGLAGLLDGLEVNIKAKAGENERLYGSVTSADIAEEAQCLTGHEIDKRKVELHEPIHQLGEYEITVKLTRDLAPTLKVVVVAEGVEGKMEEKAEEQPETKAEKKAKRKAEEPEPEVELATGLDAGEASGEVSIESAVDDIADTDTEASEPQMDEAADEGSKEPSE
jgi:large subunit ribosomal protein L9